MKQHMYRVIFPNREERKMNFEQIRKMLTLRKINYLADLSVNCREDASKEDLQREITKIAVDLTILEYAEHPFEEKFSALATSEDLDIIGVPE